MSKGDLNSRLQKFMKQKIEDEILKMDYNEIKEISEEIVKNNIQRDVYDAYTPEIYERSGDLKESVRSTIRKKRGKFTLAIGHDESMLHHKSVVSDKEVKGVPEWITEGKVHPLWGNKSNFTYLEKKDYFEESKDAIVQEVYAVIEKNIK